MLGLENRAKNRAKSIENKLPNIPSNESEQKAIEYVSLVYEGNDKYEAFKKVFPERYKNSADFAKAKGRDERAMVMATIARYEQNKFVSKVYQLGRDEYWKRFIHKKTKLLDKAYDMAMDDSDKYDGRLQLMAMKTFLDNVPDIKEDININVKHHISADQEFLNKIKARQKALLDSVDEIIDAEVSDNGVQ